MSGNERDLTLVSAKGKNMNKYIKKIGVWSVVLLFCAAVFIPSTAAININDEVYVGGMPFGVRFEAGEVVVIKTNSFVSGGDTVSPAKNAGLCTDDIIKSIEGIKINSMYDVITTVQATDKDIVQIVVEREGEDVSLFLEPKISDDTGTRQLGVILKDSSAGIGTVTFIEDNTLTFAGLGHGICDSSDGKLLKISSGYISNVVITDVNKGKVGSPGELKGTISNNKCGKLVSNTEVGVYGIFTEAPKDMNEKILLAKREEIEAGEATILCTLSDNERREYEVEISKIQQLNNSKTKNFVVKVTDKDLLSETGGIVQGMSGSPIIQNGKLVGAVTHVLVNDPTTGYGIFIENMLDAA